MLFIYEFKERHPTWFYFVLAGVISLVCFALIGGGLHYLIGLLAKLGKLVWKEYNVTPLIGPEGRL